MNNENLFLERAFESLEKGIKILWNGSWEASSPIESLTMVSDNSPSDYTPILIFPEALDAFITSEYRFSSLMISPNSELVIDANWLESHIMWIDVYADLPGKWYRFVNDALKASEADCKHAYQLKETFVSAITRLSEVLDNIKFNEIKVKWKNDIELSPLLMVQLPESLNRKIKKKITDNAFNFSNIFDIPGKTDKDNKKDYANDFWDIFEIVQDATFIFKVAYSCTNAADYKFKMDLEEFTSLFDRFFEYGAPVPVSPELSWDDFERFVRQTIDLCKKKAEVISLKFENYKTGTEQSKELLYDHDNILHDIFENVLRPCVDSTVTIPEIYAKVMQAPNVSDAMKTRFKASCLSCMEIYKCVNKLVELYNSEHGYAPFVPIPITLS